jgi:pimeloyl-ACP methyl ester carboxylesterase
MVDRNSRIKLSAGQIFWREAGDDRRPVMILLHGNWHDSNQWQDLLEPLSKDFHCFALDLLGFGNSTAIQSPTSIKMEVDCLHEFLTTLNLRPVYLVGHSLGAWIAVNYTLKHPDLVQGVVTISPEGFFLTNWRQYGFLTKLLLAHPVLLKLWLAGLQTLTSVSDGAAPLARKQAYWNFFKEFPTTRTLLFSRSTTEIQRELVADQLSQFKTPILILQTDRDDASTVNQNQAYARSIHGAEYRSIQDLESTSRHQLPPQTATEIQDFTDRVQRKIDLEEMELW